MIVRGSFRFSACRWRYVIVPACPAASQASSSAACGLRSSRVTPVRVNPNAVARRLTSRLRSAGFIRGGSEPHRFAPPAREVHHVIDRGHGLLVAICGEHPPLHVLAGWNGKKGRPAPPVARAKTPRESQQIDGESRPHQRARRQTIVESIDYRRRPKVVITSLDFPTVAYQWLAKVRAGVELVIVESPDRVSVPVDAIARAVDDRTALVVTSHVYFTSGAIQDIERVAAAAHEHGALCLIDAYQSVGQIAVDVRDAGVDALVAGGLKWLLGGPGIVFLYLREAVARRLEPAISGWFGQQDQFAFDPRTLTFHDDTRRFELGTPSLAAVYAQLGGLEYIEEIGISTIREATAALTEDLIARARAAGFHPKIAAEPQQRSAIVMIPMPDPAGSVRHLAAGGIIADRS